MNNKFYPEFVLILSIILVPILLVYLLINNDIFGVLLFFFLIFTVILSSVSLRETREAGIVKRRYAVTSVVISSVLLLFLVLYDIRATINESKLKSIGNTEIKLLSKGPLNGLTDEEINNQVDDILITLMKIHYISIRDREITDPESLIAEELEEAMNDVNKLKNLQSRIESYEESSNKIISTTRLGLRVSILSLIDVNNRYIDYLRKIDNANINVPEFQYQITLFRTSSHDTYLTMAEGVSLLPMIAVRFAEKDNEKNSVNEEVKGHFLAKIDELFGDILEKDDIYYKEKKVRNVVPVIINGYKTFFTE